MPYKRLYIFVEGLDDERFFDSIVKSKPEDRYDHIDNIVKSKLEDRYDHIDIIKYSRMKKVRIDAFIKIIENTDFYDYIFVADIDLKKCVTSAKEQVKKCYSCVNENNIVVVIKEIESWYLAGLDEKSCKKLKIKFTSDTNSITKEMFNSLKNNKHSSGSDFMIEVLKEFSVDEAKKKNISFKYFSEKYL